jgi:hypothetical protein
MDPIQAISIGVSIGLLVAVLELVRLRRLTEEYSLVWVVCALALLGLAAGRRQFDQMALWIGIYYPPALLLLVVIFIVFVVSLSFTVAISGQREQIERLIEEVALLSARQRETAAHPVEHESDRKTGAGEVTPQTASSAASDSHGPEAAATQPVASPNDTVPERPSRVQQ